MAATTALREALNQGISSGSLTDTKVILYSHRDSSDRVCRSKALYTNSHVLKTVPYFNDLLFGNFSEAQPKDFAAAISKEESAEDFGYLSDSDLEDDEDEKVASFKYTAKSEAHQSDPFGISGEDKIACENCPERVKQGKVVKIPDVALVTFQAFLAYLYTGVIEFAPFGSEENRRLRSAELVNPSDDKVPRSSPKSIYRLAHKYDVPELRTLALNHIRGELAKCDIVEESFSRFASEYDEVRGLYVQQLAFAWMEDTTAETTRASVKKRIQSFARGDLDHATEIISALWRIANEDGDVKAPTNTASDASSTASPRHWASVNAALIKSIREGVFFDRKYWARHSKTGDVLKPVYFSSIIMDDKAQKLNKLRYLKGRDPLVGDPREDVNDESDCEGDSPEDENELSDAKEETEEKTRAVLTIGSFSAWKSLFFYRCTDEISFAPLRSQDPDSRSGYIRENTVATAPPPCSPKSIYVLASLLGIRPLCESALADIKSKVTVDNVVSEFFSWVTASEQEIMEMQCDLLVVDFKDPKTIEHAEACIKDIADGSCYHRAEALQLGLEKAFELKKKKREPPGVMLYCTYRHCQWYDTPLSYSSVGSKWCPRCGDEYLRCAGCGNRRSGNHSSCQECGKKFI